jgi:hypothetical protein
MKPHEETWNWIVGTVYEADVSSPVPLATFGSSERAQLAAAAPEMARLLLGLAANWHHDRPPEVPAPVGYFRCESCESEIVRPGSAEKHMDNCELVAVLVKAGVLGSGHT